MVNLKALSSFALTAAKPSTVKIFVKAYWVSFASKFKHSHLTEVLKNNASYKGKWCLVTGADSGMGLSTARILAEHGVNVVLACRNLEKGGKAQQQIKQAMRKGSLYEGNEVILVKCDLSNFESVSKCVDEIKQAGYPISILINNAGTVPTTYHSTVDGLETLYQVSFLGHYLLTRLLWETLHVNGPSRVLWVTSDIHKIASSPFLYPGVEDWYSSIEVYGRAKLACVMAGYELHRRYTLTGSNVVINSTNPGAVATNVLSQFPFPLPQIYPTAGYLLVKTPAAGSETTLYGALAPEYENISGKYLSENKPTSSSEISYNNVLAQEVYNYAEDLLKPYLNGK